MLWTIFFYIYDDEMSSALKLNYYAHVDGLGTEESPSHVSSKQKHKNALTEVEKNLTINCSFPNVCLGRNF